MLSVAMHNYRETYRCYLWQCTITERRIDVICGSAQCIDVICGSAQCIDVICGNAQCIDVICGSAQCIDVIYGNAQCIDVICGNAQLQRDVSCYLSQCTVTERRIVLSVAMHNYRVTYGCYLWQCTMYRC